MMLELVVFSWMPGQDLNLRLSGYEPNIFGCLANLEAEGTTKVPDFRRFKKGTMSSFHQEIFLPI